MASRKQEIYREILSASICFCRNMVSRSPLSKAFDKSCFVELEFVHNIPVSILDSGFNEHDIWFLNHQAKNFLLNASESITPNYYSHKSRIIELLSLLSEKQLEDIDIEMRKFIL